MATIKINNVTALTESGGTVTLGASVMSYTSASAPGSPSTGQMYYNNVDNVLYVYNGTDWIISTFGGLGTSSTGGTITTYGNYRVHTFLSSGHTSQETFTFTAAHAGVVDILCVAGGGAGGYDRGGGGGAGGMVVIRDQLIATGAHSIKVGGRGTASAPYTNRGAPGTNSQFGSLTAAVGGGGGGAGLTNMTGGGGGSGGGSGGNATATNWTTNSAGSGTAGQGHSGGWHLDNNQCAGGGGAGGDGGVGGREQYFGPYAGGFGGPGAPNDFRYGTPEFYAGGGGGGSSSIAYGGIPGAGNRSGYGSYGDTNSVAGSGENGRGGGGGGGTGGGAMTAGSGGSGIVVVRYRI